MNRLEEIEARLNAAQPGPWVEKNGVIAQADWMEQWGPENVASVATVTGGESASATLIANAPADLRYLLDFAKAATPALKRHRARCRVCEPGAICGPCDATDQALALLERP